MSDGLTRRVDLGSFSHNDSRRGLRRLRYQYGVHNRDNDDEG